MGTFRDLMPEFEKANTQVLGISIDPFPSAGAFAKSLNLNFPLLSDWPRNEASRSYDVFDEERSTARRVTFVVDREGIIRDVVESETDMMKHAAESLQAVRRLEGQEES